MPNVKWASNYLPKEEVKKPKNSLYFHPHNGFTLMDMQALFRHSS